MLPLCSKYTLFHRSQLVHIEQPKIVVLKSSKDLPKRHHCTQTDLFKFLVPPVVFLVIEFIVGSKELYIVRCCVELRA